MSAFKYCQPPPPFPGPGTLSLSLSQLCFKTETVLRSHPPPTPPSLPQPNAGPVSSEREPGAGHKVDQEPFYRDSGFWMGGSGPFLKVAELSSSGRMERKETFLWDKDSS